MRAQKLESPRSWWIRSLLGDPVYHVVAGGFDESCRTTLSDRDQQPLAVLHERITGLRNSATILRPGSLPITVRRLLSADTSQAWLVSAQDVGDLFLIGDVLAHRATLWSGQRAVARVDDGSEPARVGYRVTISSGADRILILSTIVAVDRLLH